jgi:hypothetical protein
MSGAVPLYAFMPWTVTAFILFGHHDLDLLEYDTGISFTRM